LRLAGVIFPERGACEKLACKKYKNARREDAFNQQGDNK